MKLIFLSVTLFFTNIGICMENEMEIDKIIEQAKINFLLFEFTANFLREKKSDINDNLLCNTPFTEYEPFHNEQESKKTDAEKPLFRKFNRKMEPTSKEMSFQFFCVKCSKGFANSDARDHHYQIHHLLSPEFTCTTCFLNFGSDRSLKAHKTKMGHTSIQFIPSQLTNYKKKYQHLFP